LLIKLFQLKRKRVIIPTFVTCLGRGAMIALLAASTITLTALQASINAPTDAFRACLKEAAAKANSEKVAGTAYEAYARNACSGQLSTLKGAVIAFRVKNGMAKNAAADDANMTVDDYVATSVDKYQFMASMNAPAQKSVAPTAPVQPTPASAPQPPK
jgi:hypothetical protein